MSITYVTSMDPPPKVHQLGGSMSLFPVFRFHAPFDYHTASYPYETYITYYTITQIIPDSTYEDKYNIGTTCLQQSAVRLQTMDPPPQVHAQAIYVSKSIFPAL